MNLQMSLKTQTRNFTQAYFKRKNCIGSLILLSSVYKNELDNYSDDE